MHCVANRVIWRVVPQSTERQHVADGSDAGTTTSGDSSRISFPASVTVPANGATTLTVSVKPGLPSGTVVQGWITLTGPSGPYHFAYYAVVR